MKVVLDTNIIVSGLLSPFGASGEIVRMLASGAIRLCYDARIISEYKNVLYRPKFSFDKTHVDYLLDQIEAVGEVTPVEPLKNNLSDPDDEPFLEVAVGGKTFCLVTRNLKHYPVNKRQGVLVLLPEDFLQLYRKKNLS